MEPVVTPAPVDPNVGAGEFQMLSEFLDYFRTVLRRKAEGLDESQLRRRIAASSINLAGMLKHLAFVEDYWFSYRLKGNAPASPWDTALWEEDPDWDWNSAADDEIPSIFALFDGAVLASRSIQDSGLQLDTVVARPIVGEETMNFRWIMIHMIEEYSRHCGHADLIREAIDGQTGD